MRPDWSWGWIRNTAKDDRERKKGVQVLLSREGSQGGGRYSLGHHSRRLAIISQCCWVGGILPPL